MRVGPFHTPQSVLLGHKRLETTTVYTHVATDLLHEVFSPLEALPPS